MYPPRSSSLSLILEECKWGGNHIIMIKKKETVVSDFKIMSDLLYSRTAVQKNGLSFEKMIKKFLSLCYKIDIPHIWCQHHRIIDIGMFMYMCISVIIYMYAVINTIYLFIFSFFSYIILENTENVHFRVMPQIMKTRCFLDWNCQL